MIKKYVLLLLLLSHYLTSSKKIEVEFDEESDVIIKEGKVYLPVNTQRQLKLDEKESPYNSSDEVFNDHQNSNCEEDLVSGGEFWAYIFIILCKYTIL